MQNEFEVIIIGGSFAGLSAALALGRSMREVLVIDAGHPCNEQTPHSHNFLTQDGKSPGEISTVSRAQILAYPTVKIIDDHAIIASRVKDEFEVRTESGKTFTSKKLLLATGIKDIMPDIPGFKDCWGISVLHCPYCHGYEVRNTNLAVVSNGEHTLEFVKMIQHWSKDLKLFTNGLENFTKEHQAQIQVLGIEIVSNKIIEFIQAHGKVNKIILDGGAAHKIDAIFSRVPFEHHTTIYQQLGGSVNEQNFYKVDDFGRTEVPGLFAAGDNSSPMRSVSVVVASGTKAGVIINKELIEEAAKIRMAKTI